MRTSNRDHVVIDTDGTDTGNSGICGIRAHGLIAESLNFSGGISALQSCEVNHRNCGINRPTLTRCLDGARCQHGSA